MTKSLIRKALVVLGITAATVVGVAPSAHAAVMKPTILPSVSSICIPVGNLKICPLHL